MKRISPFPLLREGWLSVRAAWKPLLVVLLGFHLVLLFVASPFIGWLFKEALRANGMYALDLSALQFTSGIGITVLLLVVILLLAFLLSVTQFIVLIEILRLSRISQPITAKSVLQNFGKTLKKLFRPSAGALFWYVFLILPLSGFGFVSVLSQGIAVPTFISGELLKSPLNATIWYTFVTVIALLNLRFAASLPIFALTNATGGRAMRLSWRLTRGWMAIRLILAVIMLIAAATIVTIVLVIITVVPTAVADEIAPGAAATVAAFSLGIAQLLSMVLTAAVVALLTATLIAIVAERANMLPDGITLPDLTARNGLEDARQAASNDDRTEALAESESDANKPTPGSRTHIIAFAAACVLIAAALGLSHIGTMTQLSEHPDTIALGHRGYSGGGAENTIQGLEAAVEAGADMVEMDVMQTADKRFVVMHDANLARLTGMDANVKDLTFDELTQLTVRDQFGHEDKIPGLEEYVLRAAELEMPLLIEIKLGGLDTPDHVDLLVKELESLDVMHKNIFHSLDSKSVERLKQLHPDATVGYILAFAGIDVPETVADFVVIEEWSATPHLQDAAKREGLGFFSWTVNDENGIRDLIRRDADGIITDHPDLAVQARTEMREEKGLAGVLLDTLTRFVVAF